MKKKKNHKIIFCEAYMTCSDDRDVHVIILDSDRLRKSTQFLIDQRIDRKTLKRYSYASLSPIGSIFQS